MWTESGSHIHHWGTLHEQGRDVIVLGYKRRNAALRDNAAVAIECIKLVRDKRVGDAPLVVGGLSMGGLVTRHALALMESEVGVAEHGEHEVGTYFSFDSPHRGAWIPISLQRFARFLSGLADLVSDPDKKRVAGPNVRGGSGAGWHSPRRWKQPAPGRPSRSNSASSGLTAYRVATDTDQPQWRHTPFTKELCDWLTERF
jgi:hypothetical protein